MTEPLTVEIEGRTYVEDPDERTVWDDGSVAVTFVPAPLTLDDLTRIAYETRWSPERGQRWETCHDVNQAAWRAGIAAAFAAAGHPLPDEGGEA